VPQREVKNRKQSVALKRDATADEFLSALGNLGYDYMTVKRIKLDASGEELPDDANMTLVDGYAYNAKFTYYQSSYLLPFVEILSSNKNPRTQVKQIEAQSPPIGGNFTLKIGDLKPLGPFKFDIGGDELRGILIRDAKKYFNRYTDIRRFGRPTDSSSIRIRFKNYIGNAPNIEPGFANLNGGREGTKPNMTVKEILAGSSNHFYEPLPQEFMAMECKQ
jgi:hypothetical protein